MLAQKKQVFQTKMASYNYQKKQCPKQRISYTCPKIYFPILLQKKSKNFILDLF